MMRLITILSLSLLLTIACNRPSQVKNSSQHEAKEAMSPMQSDSLIINCWKHAHEVMRDDKSKVYKPCDSQDWPPSRYRDEFELRADQTARFYNLAGNDAHYFLDGTWEMDGNILFLFDTDGNQLKSFEVLSSEIDKLVLIKH